MHREGVSFSFAKSERVAIDGHRLLIAPDATSLGLREALRRHPGPLEPVHLSSDEFDQALTTLFAHDGADTAGVEPEFSFDLGEDEDAALQTRDLLEDESDAPVIRLVNQLLRRAVQSSASDLHIEPHETGLRARTRNDGLLRTVMDRNDVPTARVVSRIKVMAGLDIAETRLPQDGRIGLRIAGRAIDVRVSTLPGNFGERVVMRLLDRKAGLMPLAHLGATQEQIDAMERLSARSDGIILATGPTGSGKTTTLYSLLKLANRNDRNLVTVEDPIEYNLEGLNQTQINSDIGMTFAAGLRAALRQDPDVILVGEIRDAETATIAGQAALTGHLVFSSLHANTSVGAVVRLRDLGVENYLISATLRGVIAQRLLRTLCPDCKDFRAPSPAETQSFQTNALSVPDQIALPRGCKVCDDTGFRGRIGIYEIVEFSDSLRAAIDSGAPESELRDIALRDASSLYREALLKVAECETTLEEVKRVLGDRS